MTAKCLGCGHKVEIDEAIASRILERAKGRAVIIKEKAANYRLGGMQ